MYILYCFYLVWLYFNICEFHLYSLCICLYALSIVIQLPVLVVLSWRLTDNWADVGGTPPTPRAYDATYGSY